MCIVHDVQGVLVKATGRVRLVRRPLGWLASTVEAACLSRCDHVFVLSEGMREQLRAAGLERPIEVVPLWPTLDTLGDLQQPEGSRVLYSGSLGRKQGVATLLELAALLEQHLPEATVVIRGTGPERPALERRAAAMNITNIEFQDLVAPAALAQALAECALHVVPQRPEGANGALPSKLLNIMAVGRPAIVTASAGSPLANLALATGAIRVVAPGDAHLLAAEVMELLADEASRKQLGAAGLDWVSRWTRDDAIRAYLGPLETREPTP